MEVGLNFSDLASMQRKPVKSSSIVSVGYDVKAWTLEIEFTGGAVYRYHPVRGSVYAGLMRAPSKGRYVNNRIKPYFDCELVEEGG
jgi:hypothetical protein